jgi:hypothetical protein
MNSNSTARQTSFHKLYKSCSQLFSNLGLKPTYLMNDSTFWKGAPGAAFFSFNVIAVGLMMWLGGFNQTAPISAPAAESMNMMSPPDIEWDNTIGGSGFDVLLSVLQTSDGGYLLGGYSDSGANGDKTENSQGGNDYWVVKLDASGAVQWDNTIGGSGNDILFSVLQTSDGGYLLGGRSTSPAGGDKTENSLGNFDYWVVKLDGSGGVQWDHTIGGSGDDLLFSVIQTSDGGYLLGGYSDSDANGDKTENSQGGSDYWVVKLDGSGAVQWDNTIGGSDVDELYSVIQTSDGGYLLGGYSDSGANGDKTESSQGETDYWVVKLDGSGCSTMGQYDWRQWL